MPEIAKQRVDKAALLDQVVEDFDKIKSKHKAQVEEFDGEIGKMRKELHTGEQDRTVLCVEVFRRGEDGDGWVHTLRMDALAAVYAEKLAEGFTEPEAAAEAMIRALVERRLATPTEAPRYLPSVEGVPVDGHAPLLDQAAAAQAAEPSPESGDDADDGVPAEFEGGDTRMTVWAIPPRMASTTAWAARWDEVVAAGRGRCGLGSAGRAVRARGGGTRRWPVMPRRSAAAWRTACGRGRRRRLPRCGRRDARALKAREIAVLGDAPADQFPAVLARLVEVSADLLLAAADLRAEVVPLRNRGARGQQRWMCADRAGAVRDGGAARTEGQQQECDSLHAPSITRGGR